MTGKKRIAGILSAAVAAAAIYFCCARWAGSRGSARENLLRALPADASAVIYLDLAQLREAEILKNISPWSAGATADPDYKQFVSETGFDYEKDLDRVGIALQTHGTRRSYFARVDGNFDRGKMEAYLRKNGRSEQKDGREFFHLAASAPGQTISVMFLSDRQLLLADGADLAREFESGQRSAGHAEWTKRFERLAGTPLFALIRQDAAIGALLNNQAPGGFSSPQLGQLLNQLLWVSIAGKPEGKEFRAVLEGECPNEATMRQLSDFLNGMTIMASAGLNDPKLRRQMDPAEREAYLQLLSSVEVMKLDRGTSKSVRLTFVVTPEIWGKLAEKPAITKPEEKAAPGAKTNSSLNKKDERRAEQTARRP
jgi:hypothetical protein